MALGLRFLQKPTEIDVGRWVLVEMLLIAKATPMCLVAVCLRFPDVGSLTLFPCLHSRASLRGLFLPKLVAFAFTSLSPHQSNSIRFNSIFFRFYNRIY